MKFRSSRIALAASALAIASAGGSHAAVYSGSWDPAFGTPFAPAFGWRATAELFVPDTCVQAVGSGTVTLGTRPATFSATSFGAVQDCQGIELRNTQLFLYDTDPNTVLATLDIGTYATASEDDLYGGAFATNDQLLYLVTFVDGIVTDFQTSASLLVDVADIGDPCPASGVGFPCYDEYQYSLRLSNTNGEAFPDDFSIDGPGAAMTSTAAQTQGTGGQPYAALRAVEDDGEPDYSLNFTDSSNPPVITFRQIPEPGSLALVGAALAGLGLARRRRS